MADVRELRSSVGVFAAEVGEPLAAWQVAALGLDARTTVIVAPRQSGKSRSLAVVALHRAFREPGHRALVVSAGEEASRRLLAEVRRAAAGSPLLSGSVVDETLGLLTLTNGSEVRSLPASERQIRGWSVDTLLVDEAGLISDDLLLGAALPTTAARPDARVVLAGSANVAAGAFFDHAMLGERGSEHVRTFRWSLEDCSWISPSVVEAARESMSELRFGAEFLGVFAGSADALFPRSALDRVTVDFVPDRLEAMRGPARVFAGCDWGATTDHSALVALGRLPVEADGPVFGVRCAHAWPSGHPLPGVVEEIAGSPAAFDVVSAERNGLGEGCCQMLWSSLARRSYFQGGAPRPREFFVINEFESEEETAARARRFRPAPGTFHTVKRGVVTSAAMKAAMYGALRLLVDRERLLISASSEDLLRELLLLRVELTPTTDRIEASSGHDDLADALALSLGPYRVGDGSWRTMVGDLARPGVPGPVTVAQPSADLVDGPGGLRVPRRPAWMSVRGEGITTPGEVQQSDETEDPEWTMRRP